MASLALDIVEAAESSHVYADVNRLLKRMTGARQIARRRRRDVGELQTQLASISSETMDSLIDEALAAEQAMASLRDKSRNIGRRLSARAREESPTRAHLLRRLATASEQMFSENLLLLRDTRWELMAVLAEREPPADGPIISTAAELRAFFDALPAAQDAP